MSDFHLADHGSVVLLTPRTDAARDWVEDNLPDDVQMLGNGIAIEGRYVGDILTGIECDGLEINYN